MVLLSDGKPEYGPVLSADVKNHYKEAQLAKDSGIEIFTIGYAVNSETREILTNVASGTDHYVPASQSGIVSKFTNIVTQIKQIVPAGSNVTITDKIAEGFTYVENSASQDAIVNGQTNKWYIFSVLVVSNKSNKHMKLKFTDEEWRQHLNWLKNNSLYNTNINTNSSNQIVTIQTCYYGEPESFILVSAKKEK